MAAGCHPVTDKQTLLGVYNECLAHCDRRHTRIMSIRSTDGGHTWNGPMPLAPASDNTGWYYNCPRIQTLPDGTLLLLIDKIPLPPGKKLYEDAQNLMNAEVFLARSTDDGATWSPLQKLPLHGIVTSQVCITHTGRWIIGAHHPVNNRQCEYIIWSDDQGKVVRTAADRFIGYSVTL